MRDASNPNAFSSVTQKQENRLLERVLKILTSTSRVWLGHLPVLCNCAAPATPTVFQWEWQVSDLCKSDHKYSSRFTFAEKLEHTLSVNTFQILNAKLKKSFTSSNSTNGSSQVAKRCIFSIRKEALSEALSEGSSVFTAMPVAWYSCAFFFFFPSRIRLNG